MSDIRSDFVRFNAQPDRAERLHRLEALAHLLDTAVLIPGTRVRIGLDALIGLVPVIGDAVSAMISLYLVREARALGAPYHLVARMVGNVAIDGVVGAVPLAGDAFDVLWRANRRNMALLRKWIEKDEHRRRGTVEILPPER